jgi:asparagine synthase (glutamine-hydrolysing)
MSAVAGLWRLDGRPDAGAGCARMLASQEIYGPHDGRHWSDGPIALGRRLFRTLPEDAYDRQPLHSADGRFILVADVRLDNREELVAALGLASASRLCDAAILLDSLARWGEGALDRLVGDFAFALWDSREQRLLLARDFLGQRPLYYHWGRGFIAFATMAKGLHALSEIPYAPDEQAMAEFVTLLPPDGSRSFFKDIVPVPPAHVVTVTRDGLTRRRYWNPSPPDRAGARPNDYAEGLRHHLDQATRARLRGADGAVASHLSAGYDSAAVTATAARLLAPSGGKVVAFTAVPREGYDGPVPKNRIGDEGPLAAATAAQYPNIEHVLVRTGHLSPLEQIDRTFFLFERPTLNLCNFVWARAIDAAARDRGLGIMLIGQRGNMGLSYGGLEFLPELVLSGRLLKLLQLGTKLVARRKASWRAVLAHAFGPFLPIWLWQRINQADGRTSDVLRYTAIRADRLEDLDLRALARERGVDLSYRPRRSAFETRMWVLGRNDLGNYHKGVLGGWGIDQRDPTADRRLIEFCLGAPMEAFLGDGETRALSRRTLSDRLPPEVLDARAKGYQAVDWHEGFGAARGDFEAELGRLSPCASAAGILDLAKLQALLDHWPEAGWERQDVISAYRLALARGVSAGHFLRKSVGINR